MEVEPVSKSEFARRMQVDKSTVSNWIRRGHLSAPALLDDGTIDYEIGAQQLAERLNPVLRASAAAPAADEPASAAARLLESRALVAEMAAQRAWLLLQEQKGRYVLAERARAARSRSLATLIASVETFILTDLPPLVALDGERTALVRRAWRAWRERAADHWRDEAEVLPEFEEDPEDPWREKGPPRPPTPGQG